MVAVGHQDKLKRDRIGIIFKNAKKNAWDSRRKKKEESKHNESENKNGHSTLNHRILYLKQDDIQSFEHNSIKKPMDLSGQKSSQNNQESSTEADFNSLFENKIEADEREFVNYDSMF